MFSLGHTLEGRDLDCIKCGTGPRIGWIIHRQHPGEHMAEYFAEGLLQRLLGLGQHTTPHRSDQEQNVITNTNNHSNSQQKEEEDTVGDDDDDVDVHVQQVLSKYTLYVVPSMNPDGAVAGHLRGKAFHT